MDRLTITTFTDPMMGLTYEMEPTYEQLADAFPQLELRWVMGLLVRDVSDFMLHGETIPEYNGRLARIYESEQAIGGLPISMPDLRLFDEEHRSSLPLNLAYKAAQLADRDKADLFLWNLRHATVVDVLPTTHLDELLKVVRATGIDEGEFTRHYEDGSAQRELEGDLALRQKLGIHALPACMVSYGKKAVLVRGVLGYDEFVGIIAELTDGRVTPAR